MNKEEKKEYQKQYYLKNRERLLKQHNQWSKDNREIIKKHSKQYRKKHSEQIKEYKRKYYWKNREKIVEYKRQWAKDNPEKIKANRKYPYSKELYNKRRQFINNYKLSKGCSVCGYNKCARTLIFHHPNDDKKFSIGSNINRGLAKIEAEIKKCIILCKNCHAELHDRIKKGERD